MEIEIKHRISGAIMVSGEYETLKDCLLQNGGANLRGANLRGADLGGANLRGANLRGAKNYLNSHEIFEEMVRRQPVALFADLEWVAIAQIITHRLCWDAIAKRFADVMPSIFLKLAKAGFGEWLSYWNKKKQ